MCGVDADPLVQYQYRYASDKSANFWGGLHMGVEIKKIPCSKKIVNVKVERHVEYYLSLVSART